MTIFPLAPDQTIAQMWSNGARGGQLFRNLLIQNRPVIILADVVRPSLVLHVDVEGIDCPRGARSVPGVGPPQPADEYGEEALTFTRDLVLQREVC